VKRNPEARPVDTSESVLRFFGWENTGTRRLAIACHIIWGVALAAVTAAFLSYLDQSFNAEPDEFSEWACYSGPTTSADGVLILIFLNTFAAVFGGFIYSARSIELETSYEMKEVSERIDRNSPLSKIKIAAPCKAEWRFMYGDDRVRFCGQCNLNVYNLSSLAREEAEDLIRRTEGQLCVRFYRRKDGTILTRNCPVGLRAIKEKVSRISTAVAAVILSFFANLGLLWWIDRDRVETGVLSVLIGHRDQVYAHAVTGMMVLYDPEPEIRIIRSETFIRQRAILKVTPTYNGQGRQKGDVVVRIIISEGGYVIEADYISGPPELRELAEDAAYGWKFEPLLDKGIATRVESTLTLHFTH